MKLRRLRHVFRVIRRARIRRSSFHPGISTLIVYLIGLFWIRIAANLYIVRDLGSNVRITDMVPFCIQSLSALLVYGCTVLPLFLHRVYGDLPDHLRFILSVYGRKERVRASRTGMMFTYHPAAVLASGGVFTVYTIAGQEGSVAVLGWYAVFIVLLAAGNLIVVTAAYHTGITKDESEFLVFLPLVVLFALNPDPDYRDGMLTLATTLFDVKAIPLSLLPPVSAAVSVAGMCVIFCIFALYRAVVSVSRNLVPIPYRIRMYFAVIRPHFWVTLYMLDLIVIAAGANRTASTVFLVITFGMSVYWLVQYVTKTSSRIVRSYRVKPSRNAFLRLVIQPVMLHAGLTIVPAAALALYR